MGKNSPIDTTGSWAWDLRSASAPSLDTALPPAGELADPLSTPQLDELIAGLGSAALSSESTRQLADLYRTSPGAEGQRGLLIRLALEPPSPALDDLLEEILADESGDSYSRRLGTDDKALLRQLLATPVDDRSEMLVREAIERQGGESPDPSPPPRPPFDLPKLRGLLMPLRSDEAAASSGDDPELLRQHLLDLLRSDTPDVAAELAAAMRRDPDFGRQVGRLMTDNPFRDEMTRHLLSSVREPGADPRVRDNFLSYSHQVGADTVLPLLDDAEKAEWIPRFLGTSPSDQRRFACDDLLSDLQAGTEITLGTLGRRGPVAIAALWDVCFAPSDGAT